MKKFYEVNPTKFILEVVDSDPFLMGFFFYREQLPGSDILYFQAKIGKLAPFRLAEFSIKYVNELIWREFKNPISSMDPWEDRILKAKAHIGVLKKVQEFYHPDDHFDMIENGISTCKSMRRMIERLEFILKEFKLYEGRIDPLDLVKVSETIQSLHHQLNGKFDPDQVGPHLDIFKLLSNNLMITCNEEYRLMQAKILCLCIISFNNQDDRELFNYFGYSIRDLKKVAFESIPEKFLTLIGSLETPTSGGI